MSLYQIKQGGKNKVIQVFFPKFNAYVPLSNGGWNVMGWTYTLKDFVDRAHYNKDWRARPLSVWTGYVLNSSILTTYYKHKNDDCRLFKCLKRVTPEVAHVPTPVTKRVQKLFRITRQRKGETCL